MVQGDATDTGNNEYLVQGLVELIQENKDLQAAAKEFLDQNEDLKDLDLTEEGSVILLLSSRKSKEFLADMSKGLSEEEKFKKLAEQIGKDQVMVEKLEALGGQLFINRMIGGVALTTLTGALAGLAIGGVTGALVGSAIGLAGLAALVAIALIVYAVYEHRGEIRESVDKGANKVKEGTANWIKTIKSVIKDIWDKIPTIQARENNFTKSRNDLLEQCCKSTTEEKTELTNKIEIIGMLQNKEQWSAIKELVKEGTIQNFSEDEMKRLIDKGVSTHESDMEALKELMDKFQPVIMAIGSDIKEVEQKINEKVQEMPKFKITDTAEPNQSFPNTEKAR